ncbi:LEM domain-containing protein 2 isoform X2 [Hyla sarda]|uniref:LEM domain-containing protein 2 isoform X2 n=1 Tax=Hyla sarda TaxID=327740 RepID=UPI0024C2C0F4|nr:LEM domain-containing protein 2 isoform X2 [Hyla sarda]
MLPAGKMSDEKLRRELVSLGYTPGPITDSTRNILEKKLQKLRAEAKKSQRTSRSSDNARRSLHREPRDDSDHEVDDSPKRDTAEGRRLKERGQRRVEDTLLDGEADDSRERASVSGVIPGRRSLGYSTYTSDIPERRLLTSDISERHHLTSDIPDRRSLGYSSYTSDIPERHHLTSDIPERHHLTSDIPERHLLTSDIPGRSSLIYDRYTSDIPDRSSLSYRSYLSDIPDRSSIGYKRYPSDIPESTLVSKRYPSDIPESNSLGYDRYSNELRFRPIGERITSPNISSTTTAPGPLSYKTHPDLCQEKVSHSKPAWSKKLEHYLSRLLWLLCVIVVLVFAGILVVKSGILSISQDNDMKLLPSDCEGRGDPFCKTKQKEITLQILSELYDFLSLEAGGYVCGNPSDLTSKCIPVKRAEEHVMNVSGYGAEKFDAALDWLLSSDKHFGIWVKGKDSEKLATKRTDVFCLESSKPRLGFVCRLKNALYTAISNLFLALLGIFMLWILLIFLRYHWQRLEEEEKQMFAMVEKIIDVVKHHYKDWTSGIEQNPYIGILHVRDSLIMPQDRKRLKKVWDRAEQFVNNESRVRTEQQRVAGANLNVWRWIQTRNEHPR